MVFATARHLTLSLANLHAGAYGGVHLNGPSVELVHFTILRPPAKDDGTLLHELALIAFPVRELLKSASRTLILSFLTVIHASPLSRVCFWGAWLIMSGKGRFLFQRVLSLRHRAVYPTLIWEISHSETNGRSFDPLFVPHYTKGPASDYSRPLDMDTQVNSRSVHSSLHGDNGAFETTPHGGYVLLQQTGLPVLLTVSAKGGVLFCFPTSGCGRAVGMAEAANPPPSPHKRLKGRTDPRGRCLNPLSAQTRRYPKRARHTPTLFKHIPDIGNVP